MNEVLFFFIIIIIIIIIIIMTVAMQGGIDELYSVKTRLSRQAAFLMCYKCFTFLCNKIMCPGCKDEMADYERILESLTKQKTHHTCIFCKLLKLVREEHLKTATELVHEYIKDP